MVLISIRKDKSARRVFPAGSVDPQQKEGIVWRWKLAVWPHLDPELPHPSGKEVLATQVLSFAPAWLKGLLPLTQRGQQPAPPTQLSMTNRHHHKHVFLITAKKSLYKLTNILFSMKALLYLSAPWHVERLLTSFPAILPTVAITLFSPGNLVKFLGCTGIPDAVVYHRTSLTFFISPIPKTLLLPLISLTYIPFLALLACQKIRRLRKAKVFLVGMVDFLPGSTCILTGAA